MSTDLNGIAGEVSYAQTTGSVTSLDGTRIGFRKLGSGPGLIVLHGSNESAANHTGLAEALADAYTVYLPDRRGRGMTGAYPADYGMKTELEDLQAVMTATGARLIFGVSASGLVVLEAARTLPSVDKVAVYEPALLLADSKIDMAWIDQFDAEIAAGKVGAALVTSMLGLRLGPPVLKLFPRGLLARFTEKIMKSEDANAAADAVTLRKLAPTIRYEGVLLREMAGTLDSFASTQTEVLLMSGSKGLSWLKPSMTALETVLPKVRCVVFAGLDHGGSSDVSKANPKGKPELVAAEMRKFFAEA